MRIATVLAAVFLVSACGGGGSVTPQDAVGSWTGTWTNTTFSSTGGAKNSVTLNEATKEITFKLDLDGNVFGGENPPEETFTGTYSSSGYSMTGTSATFGTLTINVAADGTLTGSATPTRGAVTLTGSVSATAITVNYSIADSGGDPITGKIELTK